AGASIIDHHGAALFALGIIAAIVRRQRTGQGCRVDASLLQSALDLQAESLVAWTNAAVKPPGPRAFRHVAGWYFAAPYGVYATQAGHGRSPLTRIAVLAGARGDPRLALSPDSDRWTKQDETGAWRGERRPTADTAHWVAQMEPKKIWHAPVQGYAEI